MADGDQAAAAGLSVVPSTADVRLGYNAINKRGDELANHMTNGTHPFTKITGQATAAQLASNSVQTAKIVDLNVTTAKLADVAVTAAKLASNAVTTAKIANAVVTQAKLAQRYAGGSVSTSFGTVVTVNTGMGAGSFAPSLTLFNTGDPDKASVVITDVDPSNGTFKFRAASTSSSPALGITVYWTAVQF